MQNTLDARVPEYFFNLKIGRIIFSNGRGENVFKHTKPLYIYIMYVTNNFLFTNIHGTHIPLFLHDVS